MKSSIYCCRIEGDDTISELSPSCHHFQVIHDFVSTLRISIYFVTGEVAKRTKQDNVLFGLPDGSFVMVGETTASDLNLSEFHEFFPEKLSPFF